MAEHFFCGIDVAKDRLDVMMSPEGLCFSVRNDAPGWAELVVRLRPLKISAIGLEPSALVASSRFFHARNAAGSLFRASATQTAA